MYHQSQTIFTLGTVIEEVNQGPFSWTSGLLIPMTEYM